MTKLADSWLPGRPNECARLDGLLAGVRTGHSAALVIRGEAGVGKTALLDYVAESAADLRVLRAAGVESEMELAFATLHQMCGPVLDRLDRLPDPQRVALGTAFSLLEGPPPDRFLIGLAVLSLLAEVAKAGPVVCVIDDARWLDRASARLLAFAARRLVAESVLMIFAVREPDADLDGLPELLVQGLREDHARQLLRSAVPWPLDRRVAEQLVAETRGNPLALLELPRGLSPAQLAGGFGLLETPLEVLSLTGRIEDSFLRRVEALPGPARLWLVVAAAEPTGDLALVWRAQAQLGIPAVAAESAVQDGLVEVGARVRFRHPLVRSAVYRSASGSERQAAHRALAEATDPQLDPDRRAWHRAQAASEPDEDLAAELMLSAGRAQRRGGLTAAAAFLERAAALTPDPGRRAGRTLAAAQAKAQAGASR
jgi:predicted ATPase